MTRTFRLHPTARRFAAIGATGALAVALGAAAMLCGCATATPPRSATEAVAARATSSARPAAAPARSMALQVYLEGIEKRFRLPWVALMGQARDMLPADDPANQPGLVATISIALDAEGQIQRAWISKRSSYHRFDNSALGVVRRARALPAPPPELAESHLTLRWHFHRDLDRACKAAFARVDRRPMSADEALGHALARGDLRRAGELVDQHGAAGDIGARLAAAALVRRDLWAAGVRLAAPWQLVQLLKNDKTDRILWDLSIAELRRRQARQSTVGVLDALTRPRPLWLLGDAATQRERKRRLVVTISCATALGHRPSDAMLARVLYSRNASNALLAADMLRRSDPLRRALGKRHDDAAVAGPLAVRLLRRGARDVETIIRDQLGGAGRLPTLRALGRYPDARFAPEIDTIARDKKAKPEARAAALRALGSMRRHVMTIYAGLRSKDEVVRRAAIAAMRKHHGNKLAASYKLAEIAYPAKDPVAADALAAMAVVNHERFVWDILRVLRRLDHDPAGQATVVKELPRFGGKIVASLAPLLKSKHAALRHAVIETLSAVGSARARALIASAEPPAATAPPKSTHSGNATAPSDSFAALVRHAAAKRGYAPSVGGAVATGR